MMLNLNTTVKVKILRRGYHLLIEQRESLIKEIGTTALPQLTIEDLKAAEDSEGYTKMPLWVLMDNFGKLHMGLDQFIDINIIVE